MAKLTIQKESMSTATHWSKTKERGSYLGLKFLFAVVSLFGQRICSVFLFPITLYFYATGSNARKASKKFLTYHQEFCKSQKIETKPLKPWSVLFHFYEFSLAGLDKVNVWQNKIKREDVTIVFENDCQNIIESNIGFVAIGSHLGNIEIIRALTPKRKNLIMNAIVYTDHARNFNDLLKSINPDANLRIIQVRDISIDTSIMLKQKIDDGEAFTILADRIPDTVKNRYLNISFLGHSAAFPQGPFILASLMECPVLTAFCIKTKPGKYTLYIKKLTDKMLLDRKNREASLLPYMTEFVKQLEHHSVANPTQWYSFFDFWESKN